MSDHPEVPTTPLVRFVLGGVDLTEHVASLELVRESKFGPYVEHRAVRAVAGQEGP